MKRSVPVYYFNDRKTNAFVALGALKDHVKVPPATGKTFRVLIGMDQIPYIKVWETNIVLISGIDPKAVEKADDQS